ncbi:MAG: GIY-YIG nuclease family protein [Kineosporiaceae bacterium]
MQLSVAQHDVRGLESVAHLFPRASGRCGIYRLIFADGQEYVGQAVDVVRRFTAHRRRWADLVTMGLHRCPPERLDEVEQAVIAARRDAGAVLRNVIHVLDSPSAGTDLALVVTTDEQADWLAGGPEDQGWRGWERDGSSEIMSPGRRSEVPGQRDRTVRAYARLCSSPLADDVVAAMRAFVATCVPFPDRTEGAFWVATAAPSTNHATWPRLGALSVNAMEVLVLGHHVGRPRDPWGFLVVRRSVLKDEPIAVSRARRRAGITTVEVPHRAAAKDGVALEFREPSVLIHLLTDREQVHVARAARSLILALMRQGPTVQRRWHCPQLADDLLVAPPTD